MTQLLAIEQSFLSNPAIKSALKLTEIKRHLSAIEQGAKKKFLQHMELSKVVRTSYEWFTSDEGQRKAAEEGISWNAEQFAAACFGWKKSWFHKVLRASKVEDGVVQQFHAACDILESQGGQPERTLEKLLKFAKELETPTAATGEGEGGEGGEGEGEGESAPSVARAETILTFSVKGFDGVNIAVRVDSELNVKTTNDKEAILNALQSFANLIKSMN